MFTRIFGGVLLATLTLTPAFFPALARGSPQRRVTVVFDQALPNAPGKSLKGVLVEYGPGGSSRSPRQPASAFLQATVLEGVFHHQVNAGDRKSVGAGKSE